MNLQLVCDKNLKWIIYDDVIRLFFLMTKLYLTSVMLVQNVASEFSFSYLLIQWYCYIAFVMRLHVHLYLVADVWFNYEYAYNLVILMFLILIMTFGLLVI